MVASISWRLAMDFVTNEFGHKFEKHAEIREQYCRLLLCIDVVESTYVTCWYWENNDSREVILTVQWSLLPLI